METCVFCGYENVSGTQFCEGCGSGLTPDAQGHRYSTGSVAAHAAAGTAPRGAGSRFTTGDVSEDNAPAPSSAVSRHEAPPAVPASAWPARDEYAAAPRTKDDERGALIGTDATWGAHEPATRAGRAGSGPIGAAQPSAPPPAAATPPLTPPAAAPFAPPVAAPPAPSVAAPSAPPAAVAAGAYLVSESGRRVDVPAQDVVIVGREDMRSGIRPDVDLTLDGASAAGVSRRHCRLLRQADGWYVEDLMSTNFTVLNGKALPPHTPTHVQHGDELRLGKMRLRFQQS